ncbi:MAG: efflux RND transporter periplasmic adaptor subunit [Chloroflexota bacterium]
MTKKRLFTSIMVLLTAVLLISAQTNVQAAPAAQGGQVTAEGQVVPLFDVNLSFQTGGVVAEILVSEGDTVTVGAPLIRLQSDDVELALAQARARQTSAEAALNLVQNQLALAEAAVTTAETQVLAAEANLALIQAGPRPEEIAAAESAVAAANAAINQAAGQRDTALNVGTTAQIRSAEAQVAAAQAQAQAIQDQYDAIIDACFELPDGSEVCPLYGAVEETTRAQLAAAQQNQAAAQAGLDALLAGPTAAQNQAAQGGVALATAARNIAQAQLDLLLAGATPEQIAIAEVGVLQAQVGVDIAQAGVTQAQASLTQAEAGVAAAEAGVAAAEAMLDRMTLTSTIDGTVSRISTNVGELVGAGVPVVSMADFSRWLVKTTDLTELDVAFITVGDSATVSFDAIPGETVAGTVTNVALMAGLSRGDVVYEVTLDLEPAPNLPLRWGMTAVVNIES